MATVGDGLPVDPLSPVVGGGLVGVDTLFSVSVSAVTSDGSSEAEVEGVGQTTPGILLGRPDGQRSVKVVVVSGSS